MARQPSRISFDRERPYWFLIRRSYSVLPVEQLLADAIFVEPVGQLVDVFPDGQLR